MTRFTGARVLEVRIHLPPAKSLLRTSLQTGDRESRGPKSRAIIQPGPPDGQVFFASLAGNYLGQIDLATGTVTVLDPPVPRQGARRVWSDSRGGLWITGWNSGDLFRYDSKSKTWARWHLPGDGPQPYAVYVDETDAVWVSDWGANAILRFDPNTEKFESFPLPDRDASVRQLAGRRGEVWGAESGADKLFVLKTE